MKAIDLLNVMSDIDPAFIEEASQGAAKKKSGRNKVILMTVLPMAACLFIVVGVVLFSGKSIGNMSDSVASQSATSAASDSAASDSAVSESTVCESAEDMDSAASYESADMYEEEASEATAAEESGYEESTEAAMEAEATDAEVAEEATESATNKALRGQSNGKKGEAAKKDQENISATVCQAEYEDGIVTIELSDADESSIDGLSAENINVETEYVLYKLEGDEWVELIVEDEFGESEDGFGPNGIDISRIDEGELKISLKDYNLSAGRYRVEIENRTAEFDVK